MTSFTYLNEDALRAKIDAVKAGAHSALGRARAVISAAEQARRDMSADEQARVDGLFEEVDRRQVEIENLEAELVAATTINPRITSPDPLPGQRFGAGHRSALGGGVGRDKVLALFNGTDRGGFADFGAVARAVAGRDPRLFNASGANTQVATDGGYAVPSAFSAELSRASTELEVVRPRSRFVPMITGSIALPRFDHSNRSTGHATMTGKTTPEGDSADKQKPKLELITLAAKKIVVLVPCTEELMNDSPAVFGSMLADHMALAMSARLDDVFLLGTGAAEPLGLVNGPGTVEVAKETSQVAATVVPQNLSKMVSRLAPGSFARSVWICHSSVVASLFVMQNVVRNVANTENVGGSQVGWFNVAPDGSMTLLSRPLIVTDRLQPLGTSGDIVLADLEQGYLVGQVGEMRLATDTSIGFVEGEIYFKLSVRVDGQPVRKAAITPRRGSDSLGQFVKLATRG